MRGSLTKSSSSPKRPSTSHPLYHLPIMGIVFFFKCCLNLHPYFLTSPALLCLCHQPSASAPTSLLATTTHTNSTTHTALAKSNNDLFVTESQPLPLCCPTSLDFTAE